MYIVKAKCVFYANNVLVAARSSGDQVELKINGVIVETARYSMEKASAGGDAAILALDYEFNSMGHKVLATQIIKLEVTTLDAETDVEGFIECFEEDTGTDPSVA